MNNLDANGRQLHKGDIVRTRFSGGRAYCISSVYKDIANTNEFENGFASSYFTKDLIYLSNSKEM